MEAPAACAFMNSVMKRSSRPSRCKAEGDAGRVRTCRSHRQDEDDAVQVWDAAKSKIKHHCEDRRRAVYDISEVVQAPQHREDQLRTVGTILACMHVYTMPLREKKLCDASRIEELRDVLRPARYSINSLVFSDNNVKSPTIGEANHPMHACFYFKHYTVSYVTDEAKRQGWALQT